MPAVDGGSEKRPLPSIISARTGFLVNKGSHSAKGQMKNRQGSALAAHAHRAERSGRVHTHEVAGGAFDKRQGRPALPRLGDKLRQGRVQRR